MIFPCVLPRQLEPIYSLLINCILYFLRRSFQLNSRNLEMNVNSVVVRNFRQILTLLRTINFGNVRFISSRNLTKYFANCHPRFRFPLRGGERKHFSSAKFMLSKYGRTTGNPGSVIVPQYGSSKITVFVWGKGPIHHLPKATLPCWKNT